MSEVLANKTAHPTLLLCMRILTHTRRVSHRNTDVDVEELANAVRSTLDGRPRISWEESRYGAIARGLGYPNFGFCTSATASKAVTHIFLWEQPTPQEGRDVPLVDVIE